MLKLVPWVLSIEIKSFLTSNEIIFNQIFLIFFFKNLNEFIMIPRDFHSWFCKLSESRSLNRRLTIQSRFYSTTSINLFLTIVL